MNGAVVIKAAYDHEEQLLNVHVQDTGKGIDQNDQATLFTEFSKLESTASMNQEGMGMGLFIC